MTTQNHKELADKIAAMLPEDAAVVLLTTNSEMMTVNSIGNDGSCATMAAIRMMRLFVSGVRTHAAINEIARSQCEGVTRLRAGGRT